ncbi:DUF2231 domain-containing protein [Agromyces sp. NPDC056523]|uniref:DUF2231 domain-containing protein n=1 Tax=Agromyces sp. NPDC056523 TaxID=3345850 RepID=UPI00366B1668
MTQDRPLHRAKQPRSFLAGPYGHPFHPIMVTIPIGTWIASVVFDIVGFTVDEPEPYVAGARLLILIGIVGAIIAAALGLMDLSQIQSGTRARRTALIHMSLNLLVTALFAISLIVRLNASDEEVSITGFVLSVVGVLVLSVSGYLGGMLAYRYGVRVADEATQVSEGF